MTDQTLAGPNVLLMGPAGTGKTHSIGTLADTGIETFVLFLENGLETLLGYYADKKKPVPPNLHWHVVGSGKKSFKELKANADKILTLDQKTLANQNDPLRSQHNLFNKVLEAFCDFPDDRTGQKFGPVDDWPADRVIVMDGLTGFSRAAMSMVVGGKPMASQPDWGIAMSQIEAFLPMVCDQCPCWFVLIAHVERETDNITGGIKLMPSTLGNKLPPKIAPMFSDVILTVRDGIKWSWDTLSGQADIKARNLDWKAGQSPDFKVIYESWKRRAAASATPAEVPAQTQG